MENIDESRIMKPKEEIVSIPYQQGVKEKLAVLFDLENLTPDHVLPEIFKEIEKRGFIAHPRKLIFNNIAQIKKGFRDTAVKLYHLDLVGAYAPVGKNVADFRLYIEALDLVYRRPDIKGFCIVSGDADYGELVIRLRYENRYTLGIGPKEKCKEDYVNLFDDFIFIEDLHPQAVEKKATKTKKTVKKEQPVKETEKQASVTEDKPKNEKVSKKEEKPKKEKKIKAKVKPSVPEKEVATEEENFPDHYKEKDKTDLFYTALMAIASSVVEEHKDKNQKEMYCSALIKETRERSPDYLGKFTAISPEDLKKSGFNILRKEEAKPETSYIVIEQPVNA